MFSRVRLPFHWFKYSHVVSQSQLKPAPEPAPKRALRLHSRGIQPLKPADRSVDVPACELVTKQSRPSRLSRGEVHLIRLDLIWIALQSW